MGDSTLTGGTSKKKFNIIKSSSRNQNNETKNSPFLITKLNTTSVSFVNDFLQNAVQLLRIMFFTGFKSFIFDER